jgi:hypothetical protein
MPGVLRQHGRRGDTIDATMPSRRHTDCGVMAPIRLSKGVLAGR